MIRKLLRGVWIWGPPLALMLVIFFLSSRQKISVSEDLSTNFVIFKSLHIIEYACLTLLFIRAQILSFKLSAREAIIISALMALAYGISDEIHQTFVPTRTGKVFDILIDSIGISLASITTSKYFSAFKKYVT